MVIPFYPSYRLTRHHIFLTDPFEADSATAFHEITRAQQFTDPNQASIIEKLESNRPPSATQNYLRCSWIMRDGLLRRTSVNNLGESCDRLVVPAQGRGPLMRHFHHLCHRSHLPLFKAISAWPNMKADCVTFAHACSVCSGVRTRPLARAPVEPVASPSRPSKSFIWITRVL